MPRRKKRKCSGDKRDRRAYQERLRIAEKLKELDTEICKRPEEYKDAKKRKGKKRKKINKELGNEFENAQTTIKEHKSNEEKSGSANRHDTTKQKTTEEESGSRCEYFGERNIGHSNSEIDSGSKINDFVTGQHEQRRSKKKSGSAFGQYVIQKHEYETCERKTGSAFGKFETGQKEHNKSKEESGSSFGDLRNQQMRNEESEEGTGNKFRNFGFTENEQKNEYEAFQTRRKERSNNEESRGEFRDLWSRRQEDMTSKEESGCEFEFFLPTQKEQEQREANCGSGLGDYKTTQEDKKSEVEDGEFGTSKRSEEKWSSKLRDLGTRPKKHQRSKNESTGRFEWVFSEFGTPKREQKRSEEKSSSESGDSSTGLKEHKLESEFEDLGERPKKHKISKDDSDSDINDDRDTGRFEWKFSEFGISKEEQKRKEENSSSELGDSRTGPKEHTLESEFEETCPKKHKRSNDQSNSDINDDSDTGKFEWRTRKGFNTKSKPKNNVSDAQHSESESYDDKLKSNKTGDSKKHSSKPKHDREYGERAKPGQYTKRFKDTESGNNSDFETNDGTESETEGSKTETESESNEDTSADDERTIRTDHKAQSSFNIKIDEQDWKRIKPKQGGTVMNQNWTHTFSKAFNEKVPGCVINFKYHKINSCPRFGHYFNAKATCKHPGCAIFSFKICENPEKSKNEIEVNVSVLKPIVNHKPGNPKKRNLSMKNREKVQEKLKTQTASSFHYSEFGQMTGEEINEGNYTKCQTEQVLRKAKSDWNLHDALHQDPFTELVLCQELFRDEDENSKSIKGYVQEISYLPFMVVLYMETSIENAKANISYWNIF